LSAVKEPRGPPGAGERDDEEAAEIEVDLMDWRRCDVQPPPAVRDESYAVGRPHPVAEGAV